MLRAAARLGPAGGGWCLRQPSCCPTLRASARCLTTRSRRHQPPPTRSIDQVSQLLRKRPTTLCLKVIDVSDFEAGFSPALREAVRGSLVLVALTKTDLLPQPISPKDLRFMQWRLESKGLKVASVHPIELDAGAETQLDTFTLKSSGVAELATAIEGHQGEDGRDVVVCGAAGSGKSTLVRALSAELCRRRGEDPPQTPPVAPGRPARPESVAALSRARHAPLSRRRPVLWDTPGLVPPFSLSRRLLPGVLAPLQLGLAPLVPREPLRAKAGQTILLEADGLLLAGGQPAGAAAASLGGDLGATEMAADGLEHAMVLGSIDLLEGGAPTVEVQYFGPAGISLRVVPSSEAPRELRLAPGLQQAAAAAEAEAADEADAIEMPMRRGGSAARGGAEAAGRPRAAEGGGSGEVFPLEPVAKLETFTGPYRGFLRAHGVDVAFSELGWLLLTGRSDVLVAPRCVRGSRYWCRSPFYGKNYAMPQCESYLDAAELLRGVESGALVKGVLNLHRSGNFGHVQACLPRALAHGLNLGSRDLRLEGARALNRATHGDEVYARLLPRTAWKEPRVRTEAFQDEAPLPPPPEAGAGAEAGAEAGAGGPLVPCGEVVGLASRGGRTHVATIRLPEQRDGSALEADSGAATPEYFLAFPRNKRIPALRLLGLSVAEAVALRDQLLLVRVGAWEKTDRSPVGELEGNLGPVGDLAAESEAILRTHEIVTDAWTDDVTACLPAAGAEWRPSAADLEGRLDLREGQALVASIDPPGCVDIDDALHCHEVSPGKYEVGVHIADVSHFVAAGCALDLTAAKRGTSTYLVEQAPPTTPNSDPDPTPDPDH